VNLQSPQNRPRDLGLSEEAFGTGARVEDRQELEREVEFVLDDCFFAFGQAVGMRTTIDYDAVMWVRDHYRARFLSAMLRFGNRWTQDRTNVTGVAMMLGERAARYSESRESIDLDAARRASADVERYCQLHARRTAAKRGLPASDANPIRIAGYWCPG